MRKDNRFERTKANTRSAQYIRSEGTSREFKHLWYEFLSTYPIRFRRYEVIGDFTVDFFCYRARLAIDIRTPLTLPPEEQREKRLMLRQYDIEVFYIRQEDVWDHFDQICASIDAAVQAGVSRTLQSAEGGQLPSRGAKTAPTHKLPN